MSDIFLLPGKLAVLTSPGVIRTVLGSCVAVVLYDLEAGIGGVNHYLLPEPGHVNDGANRLKYASSAIPTLLYDVLEAGATPEHLKAEIYGGGAVIDSLSHDFSIGDGNIAAARAALERWNVPIVAEDVGGKRGRKIAFRIPDFTVVVSLIAA